MTVYCIPTSAIDIRTIAWIAPSDCLPNPTVLETLVEPSVIKGHSRLAPSDCLPYTTVLETLVELSVIKVIHGYCLARNTSEPAPQTTCPWNFKTIHSKITCFLRKLWKGFWYTYVVVNSDHTRRRNPKLQWNKIWPTLTKLLLISVLGNVLILSAILTCLLSKLPSLTTIIMRFVAVSIRESSFNIYLKWFLGIKPYFVTFMKNQNAVILANIHLRAGRLSNFEVGQGTDCLWGVCGRINHAPSPIGLSILCDI